MLSIYQRCFKLIHHYTLEIIHLVRTQIFEITNISYLVIRTHTSVYQGVRHFGFSENFAYVMNRSFPHRVLLLKNIEIETYDFFGHYKFTRENLGTKLFSNNGTEDEVVKQECFQVICHVRLLAKILNLKLGF